MSHFTRVATRLADRETLRSALIELGYEPLPTGQGVHGYFGQRATAEFKIRPTSGPYEIGFVPSKQGYTVVADWWGIHELEQDDFVATLRRQYAVTATLTKLKSDGYRLDERTDDEQGTVRLVLRRTVG